MGLVVVLKFYVCEALQVLRIFRRAYYFVTRGAFDPKKSIEKCLWSEKINIQAIMMFPRHNIFQKQFNCRPPKPASGESPCAGGAFCVGFEGMTRLERW
jgi:hypothetical protein